MKWMKSKVAVITCDNYSEENVRAAVQKGIDLLGGISGFVKSEEKILLKPNMLVGDKPERGTTTHPMVLRAVAKAFKVNGASLFYGDSPGVGKPERAVKQAGYKDAADALHMELADFHTAVKISFPEAVLAKQLFLAKGALEVDGIVSISKMKTHGFTRITGAVKNQFGCIPGFRKAEYHVKMQDIYDFSRVLVDINRYLQPRLYIMDGIVAMEGNSPRGGELVNMKVLLFSTDPVALDTVCCRLIDLDPDFVPTNKIGTEAGLGTYKEEEIEIVGCDSIDELVNKNLNVTRRPPDRVIRSRAYPAFLKNYISPRPVTDPQRCVRCGQCVLQCPVDPKALDWPKDIPKQKKPVPAYDYKRCIRCYCCQEICPEKAITIKVPLLGRLIHR